MQYILELLYVGRHVRISILLGLYLLLMLCRSGPYKVGQRAPQLILQHLILVLSEPVLFNDTIYDLAILGEEQVLAVIEVVLPVGFRDLPLEYLGVVELQADEFYSPIVVNSRLVVVPNPDQGDCGLHLKINAQFVGFAEFRYPETIFIVNLNVAVYDVGHWILLAVATDLAQPDIDQVAALIKDLYFA